ncbi:MAG: DUF3276 family protein [Spirochaetota bacterium]
MGTRGEVYSTRAFTQNERRTYFFNVKENRNGDLFLNIVESKKHPGVEFERHQIVVFEEDLDHFMDGLNRAVKTMRKKPSGHSGGESGSDQAR